MLSAAELFSDHPSHAPSPFLPSFLPNVGYGLLQLQAPDSFREQPDYREKWQTLLETACGAAKNKFPNLTKVIGIDAPKFSGGTNAKDFIRTPRGEWTDEMCAQYGS